MTRPGEKYDGDCRHPLRERSYGGYRGFTHPRYPLRYGSAEVDTCCICGAWYMPKHSPQKWYSGPYRAALAEAVREMEETL